MSRGDDRVLPTVGSTWSVGADEAEEPDEPDDGPRYRELGPLGRGGLGEVVEVEDADLRRVVALKRPLGEPTAAQVHALVREAQITAQLAHPGVPAVHALGIDEVGRPYFTMTRLRGRTLADVLREGPLPAGRAVRWFVQLAWAVAYAHDHGVVHRDLKPANVIVGDFGDLYVLDWGISRVVGHAPDPVEVSYPNAGSTRIEGTPGYAAPEQLQGLDGDARTDIYALGAMLFEMLSGQPPVSVTDPAVARENTLHGRLRELHGPISPVLVPVVRRALAQDPADRYPTVAAFVADLEAWQDGAAVSAYSEDPVHQLGRLYLSRSPGLRRMRWIDVDLWCFSAFCLGMAAVAAFPGWVPWWASLLVCAITFVPPLLTVLRPDPTA
ncbi:MAG: serine/threonine protein kinase [Alphaproteobacteria bacterium]|nr:serine/threonine protein kinase [Alphaproteobacteria bacterium]